ncbi:DUF2267 domain-containing protein [Roseibium aggregatum]|uniref:DUF2267 domain-containing protein n=1 Tax=Roseibium aggregatum TaxID=187304 RepID=A0A926NT38_9HYPH|nr:DUF2267 domain-containing protein [Roseibium aggregatum]MBD1545929.1 DUF2267 domain-containing protein [Roseibium aggregatum]
MPMPDEYQRAGQIFEGFLEDARIALDLTTRNQTYTTVQGVLIAFRRRLTVAEGLRFANELPVVLRALFVKDWDIEAPPVPFSSREDMTEEVCSLRRHHNFSPANAIEGVARALRTHVDETVFDAMLGTLPEGAVAFWEVAD